jgi:AcrR family transcriptional regulator
MAITDTSDSATPPQNAEQRPRDRRRARARRGMAEAAVRLIDKHGFGNVTVEQIASAADYSASSFFRHFGTKEDAVFYDIEERLEHYRALTHDTAGDERRAWSRVREVLLSSAEYWAEGNSEFATTRTRLFHQEPALFKRYLDICNQYEAVIARIFADERGADPEQEMHSGVIAAAIVGAWRVAYRVWVLRGGDLRKHLEAGLQVIEDGIHPTRP